MSGDWWDAVVKPRRREVIKLARSKRRIRLARITAQERRNAALAQRRQERQEAKDRKARLIRMMVWRYGMREAASRMFGKSQEAALDLMKWDRLGERKMEKAS